MFPSIFTDEIHNEDIAQTLKTLAGWGYAYVDFRNKIFGKPIDSLDQNELKQLVELLKQNNLKVGCLQSSLAKCHLPDDARRQKEMEKLEGLIRAADALDCRLVRAFNYWQPQQAAPELHDKLQHRPDMMEKVLDAFAPIAKRAKAAGMVLGFENCGQSPREVLAFLDALDEPTWALAWDPHDDWNSQYRKDDEVEYMIELAQRCNMLHVKAKSVIPKIINAHVPWDRVFATCAAAGLKGPVSVETHYHNPDEGLSGEQASKACYDHIIKNWPAAAPGDIREAAKPICINIKRDWEDNPVGFVIVGMGMGRNRARSLVKTPGCKLIGVCDIQEEKARSAGDEFGVPWTTDFTKWLDNDAVDVVCVFTPTGQHGEIAIPAMRAGKHVITTKPMDATLAMCNEMIQVAKENNVLLAVDYEKRFDDDARIMAKAVKDGLFGEIHFASAHLRIHRTQAYYDVNGGWHGTWKLDGGGTFSNQCIHLLDELICALGMPSEVRASLHTVKYDIEAEDLGLGEWRYDNGTVVRVFSTTTWTGSSWDSQIEICGEKGCYLSGEGSPLGGGTRWYLDEKWTDKAPVTVEKTWANAADNMAAAIRTGAALTCDGASGAETRAVLEAMYESARFNEGKWVMIADVVEKANAAVAMS